MLRQVAQRPGHRLSAKLLVRLLPVLLLAGACTPPSMPQFAASPDLAATSGVAGLSSPASQADDALRTASPLETNLRFERISVGDGLSQSTVNCILQDRRGFMWFGTDDGLNRYDGYGFTVYKHDPDDPDSLSHSRVQSLFEDSAGVLWVGTYGGGLNRFEGGRFSHYDADDFQNITDEPEEFRNVVWAIGEQPEGVLWIATYGGGLVRFDQGTEIFTSYAPDPADPAFWGHEWISAMLIDTSGQIWLGSHSEGLDRFDPATGQMTSYRHDPAEPSSLGHDWISEVIEDRSGAIWIGTYGGGLDRFDPDTGTFDHYRHHADQARGSGSSLGNDFIWSLLEDTAGVLWVGTYGGGLDAFDLESGTFTHFGSDPTVLTSLSSDRIRSLYQDRSGVLWVGTRGGGVNRSDPASGRFAHVRGDPGDPRQPSDYQVLALHEDKAGILWIGTAGGGLDALDRRTGAWRHYRHDPADPNSIGSDSVQAIHQDSSGIFWIGTDNGFYRFDPNAERFERMPHNPPDPGDVKRETIYSIFEDREGILWLGTHGKGLSEFDPATREFTYHQQGWDSEAGQWVPGTLSNNWVHDVLEDPGGMLWIGTQEGLSRYDREAGAWSAFQHDAGDPNSLSHNWVQTLHLERSGDLWVGTLDGGLNKLDPATGTFAHYRERDGLANDIVLDIVEGDDYLWIATANGLSRFDPGSESFKSFAASDGLPINEFSTALKGGSGKLFFGGINGFISFHPDQMVDNAYLPPVVLTSLEQNGVQVEISQAPEDLSEVTFRWPDNSFEFGFAALNYTQPEKNQHAYMLEGFDDDWNYIGTRRFGRYTNLPGGSYTLRLKGSNNDGAWNEVGTSMRVTIVPPFWQTWWFWGGVVLALAAGVVLAYRLRVRTVEARSRELQGQVASRTRELSALNAVAAVVSRSLDRQRVLDSALDKTLEVMQIETGGIYLLEEGAGRLMLAAYRGLSAALAAGIDKLEVGEGLSGRVVQSGEPLVVEDLTADPRLARQAVRESGFRSVVIAPLVSRGKVLGALFVMPRVRRSYSQQEVELLSSIGGQIGVAVENARLFEHAQEVAVVEERQRLARDLHDAVTQTLFSTSLIAEVLPQIWERDPEDGRRRLEQVRQATRSALAEMRTLLLELRPTGLAEADLGDLLRQLAEATSGRGRVAVEVEVSGVCILPPEVHVVLYRIAQEALNNVVKHARANQATVRLECRSVAGPGEGGGAVSLSIHDDGRGFDPDEIASGHLGLGIMRERAEAIGSCLAVESEPGRGTEIALLWPNSHKESRDQSEKHCY